MRCLTFLFLLWLRSRIILWSLKRPPTGHRTFYAVVVILIKIYYLLLLFGVIKFSDALAVYFEGFSLHWRCLRPFIEDTGGQFDITYIHNLTPVLPGGGRAHVTLLTYIDRILDQILWLKKLNMNEIATCIRRFPKSWCWRFKIASSELFWPTFMGFLIIRTQPKVLNTALNK